jgi:hypothetical protein
MKKLYVSERTDPFLQHYVTQAADKASLNSPRSNPINVKCITAYISLDCSDLHLVLLNMLVTENRTEVVHTDIHLGFSRHSNGQFIQPFRALKTE